MENNLETIFIRIAPDRFHFLKFIIEGYDNLAIISSENNKTGIVKVRYSTEVRAELFDLLTALSPQISQNRSV